jgi:hypothetical protein
MSSLNVPSPAGTPPGVARPRVAAGTRPFARVAARRATHSFWRASRPPTKPACAPSLRFVPSRAAQDAAVEKRGDLRLGPRWGGAIRTTHPPNRAARAP